MEATENTQTKRCTKCGRELPLSEFGVRSRSKDGLSYMCRDCTNETMRESRKRLADAKRREAEAYPSNFHERNKSGGGNPLLADFTARDLMEELRARGYRGQLEYTSKINIETI